MLSPDLLVFRKDGHACSLSWFAKSGFYLSDVWVENISVEMHHSVMSGTSSLKNGSLSTNIVVDTGATGLLDLD